jgi:hypothetical protein
LRDFFYYEYYLSDIELVIDLTKHAL